MFIDVCFPNNNEDTFIEIAKKLGVPAILFIYHDKKTLKNVNIDASKGSVVQYFGTIEKKEGFLISVRVGDYNKKLLLWNIEDKNVITQVHVKEVSMKNFPVVLPLSTLYAKRRLDLLQKYSLIFRLCQKYKVTTVAASCAESPYELRSEKEIYSLVKTITMKEMQAKLAIESFHDFLTDIHSTSFL